MNNQKLLLSIAILLTVFLLWDKWHVTHTVDVNGNTVRKASITLDAPAKNAEVPDVDVQQADIDFPLPNTPKEEDFTTVNTDLLSVEINHKGGTIQSALLNAFPVELKSDEKFQLLSAETSELFQAD